MIGPDAGDRCQVPACLEAAHLNANPLVQRRDLRLDRRQGLQQRRHRGIKNVVMAAGLPRGLVESLRSLARSQPDAEGPEDAANLAEQRPLVADQLITGRQEALIRWLSSDFT